MTTKTAGYKHFSDRSKLFIFCGLFSDADQYTFGALQGEPDRCMFDSLKICHRASVCCNEGTESLSLNVTAWLASVPLAFITQCSLSEKVRHGLLL